MDDLQVEKKVKEYVMRSIHVQELNSHCVSLLRAGSFLDKDKFEPEQVGISKRGTEGTSATSNHSPAGHGHVLGSAVIVFKML